MALRYGSKNGSALRYNPYSALALRYGSKTAWSMGDGGFDTSTPTDNSYFTFTLLEDDTYSVKAADITNIPAEVVLPSTYNGMPVTKVDDYAFIDITTFASCTTITTLVIPDSIITIGNAAFYNCDSLTSVEFGDNVTSIGRDAFSNCSNLANITIPNSVASIGVNAFSGTAYFNNTNNLVDGVLYIGNHLISPASTGSIDEHVAVKEGTITIADSAFSNCVNLTSIVIPDSVTFMGSSVFYNNTGLTIYCEATEQPEGWKTDWNTDNRPVVWGYIPPTSNAYFTYTLLSDGTYSIKANGRISDTTLGIPDSYNGVAVTEISNAAFFDYSTFGSVIPNVKRVYIPDSIKVIYGNTFTGASQLETVTFGANSQIAEIHASTFASCSKLKEIELPDSITIIDDSAFYNCASLENINIPSGVTRMGTSVFNGCSILTEITLPIGLIQMSSNVFAGCSNLVINCEAESKPEGWDSNWNPDNRPVVWGYTG